MSRRYSDYWTGRRREPEQRRPEALDLQTDERKLASKARHGTEASSLLALLSRDSGHIFACYATPPRRRFGRSVRPALKETRQIEVPRRGITDNVNWNTCTIDLNLHAILLNSTRLDSMVLKRTRLGWTVLRWARLRARRLRLRMRPDGRNGNGNECECGPITRYGATRCDTIRYGCWSAGPSLNAHGTRRGRGVIQTGAIRAGRGRARPCQVRSGEEDFG